MKQHRTVLLAALSAVLFCGADWRQFRGTHGTGVADGQAGPEKLTDKDIAWKAPLIGRGPAGPIVVAGKVFVTASSAYRESRLHLLAFDAATGRPLWHRQLWATGHTVANPFGAVADNTPASDGQRIYAFFSSNDLVCFDLDGNLLWHRGLAYETPMTRNDVGMASSPIVVGRTVVVQMESQSESYAAGIDADTGQTRWRADRRHEACWTTPIVVRPRYGAELVVLQSKSHATALDPATGRQLWDTELACSTMSTGVAGGETLFLPADGLYAFRLAGQTFQPVWEQKKLRCATASPMLVGDRLYLIKSPSILVAAKAADGEQLWQVRLKGPMWATPAIVGDLLYAVSYDGLVQVVKLAAQEGKLIATGQIDGKVLASPAAADGAVYFRTDQNLWKFGRK